MKTALDSGMEVEIKKIKNNPGTYSLFSLSPHYPKIPRNKSKRKIKMWESWVVLGNPQALNVLSFVVPEWLPASFPFLKLEYL